MTLRQDQRPWPPRWRMTGLDRLVELSTEREIANANAP
jgi:hypothetical protein